MPILSVDKTIDRAEIARGGAFRVTLRVTAAPKSEAFPADIALVLDRSGSMRGAPMDALKAAPTDKVRLELSSGVAPCVILPAEGEENFLYMVLPVRLKAGE